MGIITNELFIKKLKESGVLSKFEILTPYTNIITRTLLKNKYGILSCNTQDLWEGKTPTILSAVDKTSYFINQLLEINPDFTKHFKLLNKYKNSRAKLYFQTQYGICKISPYKLLAGSVPSIYGAISYSEYWTNLANDVRKRKYIYKDISITNEKVTIICRKCNHTFSQNKTSHINNMQGCPKCADKNRGNLWRSSTEEFIEKAQKKHGDKYDYSLVDYKLSCKPIEIRCKQHNFKFNQIPNSHLKGAEGCIVCRDVVSDLESWKNKANRQHNGFYSYSEVKEYTTATELADIFCPIHGNFKQQFSLHAAGYGCPTCGIETSQQYYAKQKGENINSIPCILYILRLYLSYENFYKVGFSKNFKARIREIKKSGYKVEVERTLHMTVEEAIREERRYLNSFHFMKYEPSIYFEGHTECFKDNPLNYIYYEPNNEEFEL